ncbi:MAG: carboxypeptidase regulatory-like domain-containing protein [Candidatus Solibacter usitatus]|nr:carboxypeptidase regulatory-like domain-containing protein [Candidatus Solibacter usitatus]
MKTLRYALLALLVSSPCVSAQSVTGQISGTVTDPIGAVIAGAKVSLTHDLSRQLRAFITDADGNFLFTNLMPGNYSVRIAHPGFKGYDQKGIVVTAEERVSLHQLKLSVGDTSTTVEVVADLARVSTESSDRSILINQQMIEDTPISGRDYLGILRSLPGVQMVSTSDMPGWFNTTSNPVNGGQHGQFLVTIDGVASQDSGNPVTGGYLAPNIDAIGEVKVLVSNFTAEYGARAGGQMNVSVKNGTNRYHGSAYYFWRHEMLAANEFFNNKNLITKPRYRYQNPGLTIGGPLVIPGTNFNKSRTRLFFFFSEDFLHTITTGGVGSYNMPSELERGGDFSRTTTTTGVLIPVKDPTTATPFPGNIMPASQISPIGYAMMNLFPLPFTTDSTGRRQFNSQYQFNRDRPREDRILRLDFNLSNRTTSYLRLIQDFQADRGVGATLNGGGGWGQFASNYDIQSAGAVYTVIHTFRSNLINETTVGVNRGTQGTYAPDQAAFKAVNDLSALKGPDGRQIKLPHFFDGNYLNIIPRINFGANGAQSAGQAVTSAPTFGFDSRWPFHGTDQLTNITDTLSWIKRKHNVKGCSTARLTMRKRPDSCCIRLWRQAKRLPSIPTPERRISSRAPLPLTPPLIPPTGCRTPESFSTTTSSSTRLRCRLARVWASPGTFSAKGRPPSAAASASIMDVPTASM